MATVTVYFVGVCTHLTKNSSGVAPHRVILIDASSRSYIRHEWVEPHDAKLVYANGDAKLEQRVLNGVRLTLNAKDSKLDYEASFGSCLPHMQQYAALPPLNEEVVRNGAGVAAFFDVEVGTFSAGVEEKVVGFPVD